MTDIIKEAVHAWICEDLDVGAKMLIGFHGPKLIARLEAAQLLERGSWKPGPLTVAMLIDPEAWDERLWLDKAGMAYHQGRALTKARAILALSPDPAFLGEIEEASREKPDDLERTADKPPNPHGDHRP